MGRWRSSSAVFQIALAFCERIDHEGNEVDVHARNLGRKPSPVDKRAFLHATGEPSEFRELSKVKISRDREHEAGEFSEQANEHRRNHAEIRLMGQRATEIADSYLRPVASVPDLLNGRAE